MDVSVGIVDVIMRNERTSGFLGHRGCKKLNKKGPELFEHIQPEKKKQEWLFSKNRCQTGRHGKQANYERFIKVTSVRRVTLLWEKTGHRIG